MRQREYVSKAERRIKRITDEAHAKIMRTISDTIHKLEKEKLEYVLRLAKRAQIAKPVRGQK